jgi:hypothetical protein
LPICMPHLARIGRRAVNRPRPGLLKCESPAPAGLRVAGL